MSSAGSDNSSRQDIDSNIQDTADIYEDEICLIGYFLVIWKHRYLVLLGSIIPAVVAGLFFLLSPRDYKATYVYNIGEDVREDTDDWNFSEKNYLRLLDAFRSQENTNEITTRLPNYDLHNIAFNVWPSYSEQKTPQLLYMSLVDNSKEELNNKSTIIRDNFESIMPLYFIEQHVVQAVKQHRGKLAGIERGKFNLRLSLDKNKNILTQLKIITTADFSRNMGNITLQFDIGKKSEYLPLEYQIQATELKVIELQEEIDANEKLYAYHKKMLGMNNKILEYLKNKSTNYTLGGFHTFLTTLIGDLADTEQTDYLNSYIKSIENRISLNVPVTTQPEITALPRGMVKKSSIVFAIALMLSVFVSFLREGINKTLQLTS